jgi:hypothetical protein
LIIIFYFIFAEAPLEEVAADQGVPLEYLTAAVAGATELSSSTYQTPSLYPSNIFI